MTAIDTSSLIAYLEGSDGDDVEALDRSLESKHAVLPPVVLCELLSDADLSESVVRLLKEIPLLPVLEGYWERAGILRSKILASGRKARLADTLIAQSCIDHDVALITRDKDFLYFARTGQLKLV